MRRDGAPSHLQCAVSNGQLWRGPPPQGSVTPASLKNRNGDSAVANRGGSLLGRLCTDNSAVCVRIRDWCINSARRAICRYNCDTLRQSQAERSNVVCQCTFHKDVAPHVHVHSVGGSTCNEVKGPRCSPEVASIRLVVKPLDNSSTDAYQCLYQHSTA